MATKSAARTWLRSSASAGSKFDFVTCFRGNAGTDGYAAAEADGAELKASAKARDNARAGRCLFILQALHEEREEPKGLSLRRKMMAPMVGVLAFRCYETTSFFHDAVVLEGMTTLFWTSFRKGVSFRIAVVVSFLLTDVLVM